MTQSNGILKLIVHCMFFMSWLDWYMQDEFMIILSHFAFCEAVKESVHSLSPVDIMVGSDVGDIVCVGDGVIALVGGHVRPV